MNSNKYTYFFVQFKKTGPDPNLKEEHNYSADTQKGSEDFGSGHPLFIEKNVWYEYQDGCGGHNGGCNSGVGVLYRHKGERDAQKGAEERTTAYCSKSSSILKGIEKVFQSARDNYQERKTYYACNYSDLSGGERDETD